MSVTRRRVPWTEPQKAVLREHYGRLPIREIALLAGRPVGHVHRMAVRMGLAKQRPRLTPDGEEAIRRMHGEGWSDTEIAVELGVARKTVRLRRQGMGLPVNGANERYRERVRQATAVQLQAAGLPTLGGLALSVTQDSPGSWTWQVAAEGPLTRFRGAPGPEEAMLACGMWARGYLAGRVKP